MVTAIINSGPREDSTRIGRAGTVRRQAVDVSPLRRVNQAICLLTAGARQAAFRNVKQISECLADELINAAKVSYFSHEKLSYLMQHDLIFIIAVSQRTKSMAFDLRAPTFIIWCTVF